MSVQVAVAEQAASKARAAQLVEEMVGDGFDVRKFVENFDVLVNVAGSAKHLKELVLKLAFSGGLSLATDETADALLVELRRERLKLAKTGVRIGEDSRPVTDEEAPHAIPPGWRWIRLRDLGGFLGGGTPAKSNAAFWKGPLPWVSPKDMKRPYIDDAEDHISTAAVEGSAVKLIPAQSILYVVRGMILAHSFPVAVATREVTINQDMKALVLANPALSEFVLRSCQAARSRVLAKVERSSHGTCRLESEVVETLPIALPPLAEQKRIVARVDQLMALIDDLEAKQSRKREVSARFTKASLEALTTAERPAEFDAAWKRVVENWETVLDRSEKVAALRTGVLELAVRGGLSRSLPPDGFIEDLLRLLAEDVEGSGRPRKQLAADSGDAPFDIPKTWRWVRYGEVFLDTSSGWSPQCEARPRDGDEWGVLKVSAVSWATFDPAANKALPTGVAPRPEFAVQEGDFLMSRANTAELVGRSVVVGQAPKRLIISDKIIRCAVSQRVEKEFVNLYNRTTTARSHYLAHASGTSDSMKNITRDVILTVPIPLPPLAEQQRIVAKVEHLMRLCDDLEAKLRRAEDRASKLVEAVVQEMVA